MNRIWTSALLAAALAGMPDVLLAQGGPPLVTDDPDTPGDGHSEINLAFMARSASIGAESRLNMTLDK